MSNLLKHTPSPIVIAGPCSAESMDQLSQVAQSLHTIPQVAYIRCGVWKPRTHPGGFEGRGEEALKWISTIKKETPSLKFVVEVASPDHVEQCLQYGIDAVWIGSRTTGNPFSINELAQSLRGTSLPVFVKNPLNPDVQLWLGAFERLKQCGICNLAAVHRGFSTFNNIGYRNNPLWEVAIELRRLAPELPLLCDPSHIGGSQEFVAPLSQTAMDLGFDGLMIEVHPSPSEALTDASQQITPSQLRQLLQNIRVRSVGTSSHELNFYREQIDAIDQQLLQLLSTRLEVAKQIAQVKQRNNMTVFQPQRWGTLLQDKIRKAQSLNLSEEFVMEIFQKIHAESVRVQEEEIR